MNIKTNIISDIVEKYIIKNLTISFKGTSLKELNFIHKKVFKKFNLDINKNIIKSIKSSYIKNYSIDSNYKITQNSEYILDNYLSKGIMFLSKTLKLSPILLLKFIFKFKDNRNISEYDKDQYKTAKKYDVDQTEIIKASMYFEKYIQKFLDKNNIIYKTQETLTQEQVKEFGRPINTPDFLILSDLYINSKKINWIDAKNYYGANINFIITNIEKQVQKYIDSYGFGCIIFKYGFNDNLHFNNVLLINF